MTLARWKDITFKGDEYSQVTPSSRPCKRLTNDLRGYEVVRCVEDPAAAAETHRSQLIMLARDRRIRTAVSSQQQNPIHRLCYNRFTADEKAGFPRTVVFEISISVLPASY